MSDQQDDPDPARSPHEQTSCRPSLLAALPQPYHLFAALTGTRHFHLGDFLDPSASLAEAQSLLARRVADRLPPPPSRVLDLGCGMAGTASLLGARGHVVLGIDPCAAAVAFGAEHLHADHDVRLAASDLADLDGLGDPAFDALVCIEVLQHLPDLDRFLADATAHLAPGALLVVADVYATRPLAVPYHREGALGAAAERAGLRHHATEVLTRRTAPTLGHLLEQLVRREQELHGIFDGSRPHLALEIEELVRQCQQLRAAFRDQSLVYELSVHAWPDAS